ncbi:MarR family winged helix-turn-helix transcriptional regulator [Phaeobacter gallaeciensis]|uniref:MarR family winged helix-turn-helix transcriptional regulator n=1 Tax=Phaeobacter gallaeciensis TaxID=60890 RepID=UPI00237F765C|nr:MarR family transcriptional regulator [Phaeobacter gallaeciensis]MDE4191085.1 MarR family transcriptional regulator [Phaeobacter gallaeciensis]MDE4199551.1 MarR family transcriptional regulator [Phaeobacter gallaeciensis]MDE4203699.1 MarR family transcriptional regulator [Phaeobacter gallaeciensis]MDE4207841.1 MarR family transcriptional regulator [Phaeobacter gallaeciensis]MDE4216208.1 MarR family transcriptional regulator [Phaeobacter gallaeciensis]
MAKTSKDRLRLWLRVLKATRAVESEIRENLRRDFSTTLPRFDVMAALVQHEDGLKMSQLSGVLKVSNGNVTGIIERLVEDGHVQREPVPGDRRASLVRMTEQGRAEFARQAEAHEAWIDKMFADVPPEAAQTMAEALDAVARRLENKDESR